MTQLSAASAPRLTSAVLTSAVLTSKGQKQNSDDERSRASPGWKIAPSAGHQASRADI
jgi:hypothetical protein